MKIYKNINIIIFLSLLLYSCQAAEGFKLKKKSTKGEEFLIEKKDPLVLPPEFSKLPKPNDEINENQDEGLNLKTVFGEKSSNTIEDNVTENSSENTIKNSILKKIQK